MGDIEKRKKFTKKETEKLEVESQRMANRLEELQMAMHVEKKERIGNQQEARWNSSTKPHKPMAVKPPTNKPRRLRIMKEEIIKTPEHVSTTGLERIASRTIPKKANIPDKNRPLCGQCDIKNASVKCDQCSELYCITCFASFHIKGSLRKHVPLTLMKNDEKHFSRTSPSEQKKSKDRHHTTTDKLRVSFEKDNLDVEVKELARYNQNCNERSSSSEFEKLEREIEDDNFDTTLMDTGVGMTPVIPHPVETVDCGVGSDIPAHSPPVTDITKLISTTSLSYADSLLLIKRRKSPNFLNQLYNNSSKADKKNQVLSSPVLPSNQDKRIVSTAADRVNFGVLYEAATGYQNFFFTDSPPLLPLEEDPPGKPVPVDHSNFVTKNEIANKHGSIQVDEFIHAISGEEDTTLSPSVSPPSKTETPQPETKQIVDKSFQRGADKQPNEPQQRQTAKTNIAGSRPSSAKAKSRPCSAISRPTSGRKSTLRREVGGALTCKASSGLQKISSLDSQMSSGLRPYDQSSFPAFFNEDEREVVATPIARPQSAAVQRIRKQKINNKTYQRSSCHSWRPDSAIATTIDGEHGEINSKQADEPLPFKTSRPVSSQPTSRLDSQLTLTPPNRLESASSVAASLSEELETFQLSLEHAANENRATTGGGDGGQFLGKGAAKRTESRTSSSDEDELTLQELQRELTSLTTQTELSELNLSVVVDSLS